MKKLTEKLKNYPRQLLLADCAGALISAFMLGVVLVHWQNFFGIPVYALYILAAIPCFFALYDLAVYSVESANTYTALKNMAFLNIAYCIFSLGIALFHISSIKVAGWIYLIGEVIIVLLLARLELRVASSN